MMQLVSKQVKQKVCFQAAGQKDADLGDQVCYFNICKLPWKTKGDPNCELVYIRTLEKRYMLEKLIYQNLCDKTVFIL